MSEEVASSNDEYGGGNKKRFCVGKVRFSVLVDAKLNIVPRDITIGIRHRTIFNARLFLVKSMTRVRHMKWSRLTAVEQPAVIGGVVSDRL